MDEPRTVDPLFEQSSLQDALWEAVFEPSPATPTFRDLAPQIHAAGLSSYMEDAARIALSLTSADRGAMPPNPDHADRHHSVLGPVVEMTEAFRRGDFARAYELARSVATRQDGDFGGPLSTAVVCLRTAMILNDLDHSLLAISLLATAHRLSRRYPTFRYVVTVALGVTHATRGNLHEARFYQEELADFGGDSARVRTGEELLDAIIDIETLQWRSMSELGIPPVESHPEFALYALLYRGRAALSRGAPLRAIHTARVARALLPASVWSPSFEDASTWILAHGHLALGEIAEARSVVDASTGEGHLVTLAQAAVSLHEEAWEEAEALTSVLLDEPTLPMIVQGEAMLLRMWAVLGSGLTPTQTLAVACARLATFGELRRIFTHIPRWVIDEITMSLMPPIRDEFRGATNGLGFIPLPREGVALTARELAVLRTRTPNDTVAELAAALFVSPSTVKTQLASIYRKLGASGLSAARRTARRSGLLQDAGVDDPSAATRDESLNADG